MNLNNHALVFAHYHQAGKLRTDTIHFINACRGLFKRIIFISTNLSDADKHFLPDFVEWHVRDNVGYDFFSYRLGLEFLLRDIQKIDGLTLMNSSCLIYEPTKFIKNYFHSGLSGVSGDFFGLTMHAPVAGVYPHLQSYLLSFSAKILQDSRFISWWTELSLLNDKNLIIENYEIGLSKFLDELGYIKNPIYLPLAPTRIADPMHGNYREIFNKFSILKIGLLKHNPFRLNLRDIVSQAEQDELFKMMITEGLDN